MLTREGEQLRPLGGKHRLVGRHHMLARLQRLTHVTHNRALPPCHFDDDRHVVGGEERLGVSREQLLVHRATLSGSLDIAHEDAAELDRPPQPTGIQSRFFT